MGEANCDGDCENQHSTNPEILLSFWTDLVSYNKALNTTIYSAALQYFILKIKYAWWNG
jgi:hypothetical protein